jgi:hypothetical protein
MLPVIVIRIHPSAMDRDVAPATFRGSDHFVYDREQRIGWASSDQTPAGPGVTRFDEEIERVVVDG